MHISMLIQSHDMIRRNIAQDEFLLTMCMHARFHE